MSNNFGSDVIHKKKVIEVDHSDITEQLKAIVTNKVIVTKQAAGNTEISIHNYAKKKVQDEENQYQNP